MAKKKDEMNLIQAADEGKISHIRELLAQNVDVDQQDENGNTALIAAAFKGYTEIIKLLVTAGANLNIKRKDGCSALYAAIGGGVKRPDVVELLLIAGADKNLVCYNGYTALKAAQENKNREIVALLQNSEELRARRDETFGEISLQAPPALPAPRTPADNGWSCNENQLVTYKEIDKNTGDGLCHMFHFAANMVVTTVIMNGHPVPGPKISSMEDFAGDYACFSRELLETARSKLPHPE